MRKCMAFRRPSRQLYTNDGKPITDNYIMAYIIRAMRRTALTAYLKASVRSGLSPGTGNVVTGVPEGGGGSPAHRSCCPPGASAGSPSDRFRTLAPYPWDPGDGLIAGMFAGTDALTDLSCGTPQARQACLA